MWLASSVPMHVLDAGYSNMIGDFDALQRCAVPMANLCADIPRVNQPKPAFYNVNLNMICRSEKAFTSLLTMYGLPADSCGFFCY
jgi:hypothetical protein